MFTHSEPARPSTEEEIRDLSQRISGGGITLRKWDVPEDGRIRLDTSPNKVTVEKVVGFLKVMEGNFGTFLDLVAKEFGKESVQTVLVKEGVGIYYIAREGGEITVALSIIPHGRVDCYVELESEKERVAKLNLGDAQLVSPTEFQTCGSDGRRHWNW